MRTALFHHCTLCKFFFWAKSKKNVWVIYDPKCFNTRLECMCCSDCRFRYETSARVAESAATDSEGSVCGGFDGFNHSNYTTSLTPNYAQSAFGFTWNTGARGTATPKATCTSAAESDKTLSKMLPLKRGSCKSPHRGNKNPIRGGKWRNSAPAALYVVFGISSRSEQMPHSAAIRAAAGPTPRMGKEKDGKWGIEPPKPDQCTASTSGGSCISSYWSQN